MNEIQILRGCMHENIVRYKDCHLVREKVQEEMIKMTHMNTSNQPADIFTKPLNSLQYLTLLSKLETINIHSKLEGEC